MKYTIEAIENAKPGMRWEEIGCHWTLGQAYLYSKEAGNDLRTSPKSSGITTSKRSLQIAGSSE